MKQWYVMRSKPLKEYFLSRQLSLHNIEAYIPLYVNPPKRSQDGNPRNFFPGYLFVHIDSKETGISTLMWLPGSNGIVSFGGEPGVIPDAFIGQLKRKMDQLEKRPHDSRINYRKGDHVEITSGPFIGYQAVFDQYLPSSDRVRLMLKTIAEYQLKVELPEEQLANL